MLLVCAAAAAAAEADLPPGCAGAMPLGRFRLSVVVPWKGGARPVMEVASIPTGARLAWDPVRLAPHFVKNGEIAALVITKTNDELMVLDAHKADARAEWDLPRGANVIALVLGPDGLNMNKVRSLIAANEDLLPQLAAYAQQTSQVESLVQTLADSQQNGSGADAALKGFSSRWGVAMPKIDPNAPSAQNASALLTALMPAAGSYDPLASGTAQMQATTGLAASLAGMFFGNGVGLAAGGAALVANLKGAVFPNTDFRSVYAQSSGGGMMTFCAKAQQAKSRTRTAYLWAYKAPGLPMPAITLTGGTFVPAGAKSTLKLQAGENSNVKDLVHARDWRLVPAAGAPVPVAVTVGSDSLALDLAKAKLTAGNYNLEAGWDWDTVTLGAVHVRPYGDLAHAAIAPASRDKLVQGSGTVTIELTGADFEFVEKAEIEKAAAKANAKPAAVSFDLPQGPRQGEQNSLDVDIDTAGAGAYKLLLSQAAGTPQAVPVTVLPPNPKLSNLPLYVNAGEAELMLRFEGSGLDRIDGITSDAGAITGAPDHGAWHGRLRLKPGVKPGESFALGLKVHGLEAPLVVPGAVVVVGARPKIVSAQRSPSGDTGVELRSNELPTGAEAGFVLHVAHLAVDSTGSEDARPRLELSCSTGEVRKRLTLSPADTLNGASLSAASAGSFYLSLDPGQVGYPGCELSATLSVEPRGGSAPVALGRVVRLPTLEKFTLTDEALGPNSYAGVLQGRDLDVIEKAGWDAQNGLPVIGIPAPISPTEQTLKIAVPWPAPAPHAPLYIWLRGEGVGRRTRMTE